MSNLTGQLLLAHPSMRFSDFVRTVIYLGAHSKEDGAFGMILNRPLDQALAALMPEVDLGPLADCGVYLGGPVATDHLQFHRIFWDDRRGRPQVQLQVDLEEARTLAVEHSAQMRAFIGYAGWSPGQLEEELARNTWVVLSPTPACCLPQQTDHLWHAYMRTCGPWFHLAADEPDDLSNN